MRLVARTNYWGQNLIGSQCRGIHNAGAICRVVKAQAILPRSSHGWGCCKYDGQRALNLTEEHFQIQNSGVWHLYFVRTARAKLSFEYGQPSNILQHEFLLVSERLTKIHSIVRDQQNANFLGYVHPSVARLELAMLLSDFLMRGQRDYFGWSQNTNDHHFHMTIEMDSVQDLDRGNSMRTKQAWLDKKIMVHSDSTTSTVVAPAGTGPAPLTDRILLKPIAKPTFNEERDRQDVWKMDHEQNPFAVTTMKSTSSLIRVPKHEKKLAYGRSSYCQPILGLRLSHGNNDNNKSNNNDDDGPIPPSIPSLSVASIWSNKSVLDYHQATWTHDLLLPTSLGDCGLSANATSNSSSNSSIISDSSLGSTFSSTSSSSSSTFSTLWSSTTTMPTIIPKPPSPVLHPMPIGLPTVKPEQESM